jgi:ankyrin repeat protein
MKKSIVYLGIALLTFSNVSLASNVNYLSDDNDTVTVYHGVSTLVVAISKGDIRTIEKLIEYGADVNEKSNGMTPLMFAARYNKVEIMKILIAKGAKIRARDSRGFNAKKYAEISNAHDVINYLKN